MNIPPIPTLDPATGATKYAARLVKVIDGDTVDVVLEAGTGPQPWDSRVARIRLAHIDAPLNTRFGMEPSCTITKRCEDCKRKASE